MTKTKPIANTDHDMVISYRELRRIVGIIAIALPIALLALESLLRGNLHVLDSISSYYWAERTGDVLVGSLCAMGMFFLSYRGKGHDNHAGNLACVFAVCVALFPSSEPGKPRNLTNYIHYGSAAGMFLTLAYFCFFLSLIKTLIPSRRQRNPSETRFTSPAASLFWHASRQSA